MKSGSMMRAALFSLAITLGSSVACDDGVTGSSASCHEFCNKLETCDDATDVLGCEQKCTAQRVRSEVYLAARAQCTETLSCNLFLGEVDVMGLDTCASGEKCKLDDCIANTIANERLTTDQTSYCSRVVTKLNACDRTLDTDTLTTNCLSLAPTLSSAYLNDVSTCIEGDCSAVVGCLDRTQDRYDTDLSLLPSTVTLSL